MNRNRPGHASLGMYPFEQLRPTYDRLWEAVRAEAPWLPAKLGWDRALDESWLASDMVIAQTCGWPLINELADRVRVVGAFEPRVPGAVGHRYRSVLVAREPCAVADLAGMRAAVNSSTSLSGWVSLVAAVHGPGATWAGAVSWTGSHRASIAAVAEGCADVASIDAVSWVHFGRLVPELVAGLVEVGSGPLVPSLPLITAACTSDEQLAELRAALAAGCASPETTIAAHELCIGGFDPLGLEDYLSLIHLAPHPGPTGAIN